MIFNKGKIINIIFSVLLSEWLVNQHRDTYASYIGHHDIVSYVAIAENESIGRVKFNMLKVSLL
jgi:splicing factor 3B subunit 5